MRRFLFVINILFVSAFCFSQQNIPAKIIGQIPDAGNSKYYQIQVGAFGITRNAEMAFDRLKNAGFSPIYENISALTRVLASGIAARDVQASLGKIKAAGFNEVIIREDPAKYAIAELPTSTAALPSGTSTEIGYRTIKVGETKSLEDLAKNKNVLYWTSSTPTSVSVNSNGDITGLSIGNAFVNINETEYISIAVVPAENFYIVPIEQAALLPPNSRTVDNTTRDLTAYRTEPTFRLSYRFNNKGEEKGASGPNGGIDILGRGDNYRWLWTTFFQGGWFYDLNGIQREMINGYQKDQAKGIELTVKPEFVYDQGVPYLQLKHILHNTSNHAVSGQRFGASADVMINANDYASLKHTPYGAYMADSGTDPTLELMFVGETGNGINPIDTLWLGTYSDGDHLNHIYEDRRSDISGVDSAIGFSYKNISLEAGETKEYIVRFTLARNES
jgi:hypothetical protein